MIFSSIYFWLILAAVLIAGGWLLYKRLQRRWRARKAFDQRRQVEDALKLIYNLRQEGQAVDKYRLAVELNLAVQSVDELIVKLQMQGLAQVTESQLSLTAEGRRWALQVIRAHRLWERYLADEARMPLEQIHTTAHQREHRMSAAEVDSLDAALGYPARDPHGDPIPNASGVMRETQTDTSLVSLKPGQRGRITQLEDEPPMAYAQLLAEGLYVGQDISVHENTPSRIVISSDEGETILAQSIAENVFVQIEAPQERPDPSVIPLGTLGSKAEAEIVGIDDRCQGFTRRRFLDLGLTPGTRIYPELENAFKEPRAYRVRGTLIALRSDQAAQIWVRPLQALKN